MSTENKPRTFSLPTTDIDFVAEVIRGYPGVVACMQKLDRALFGLPVAFEKDNRFLMDEHYRLELEKHWTLFAQKLVEDSMTYGICVWRLEEHKMLEFVPFHVEFTSVDVEFTVSKKGVRTYDVYPKDQGNKQEAKRRKDRSMMVIDKYPPRHSDGALRSPLSFLIRRFQIWDMVNNLANEAIVRGVRPTIIIQEPQMELETDSSSIVGQTEGVKSARNKRFDSINEAKFLNAVTGYNSNKTDMAMSRLNELLCDFTEPVRFSKSSGHPLMVVQDGGRFVSGDGTSVPFIPDRLLELQLLNNDISAVTGVPRAFWAETESRFKIDSAMANGTFKETVQEWASFVIRVLNDVYNLVYQVQEAEDTVLHKAPSTQVSLPATMDMETLVKSLELGLLTDDKFKRHAARLLGQIYDPGFMDGKDSKDTKDSKETKDAKDSKGNKDAKNERKRQREVATGETASGSEKPAKKRKTTASAKEKKTAKKAGSKEPATASGTAAGE